MKYPLWFEVVYWIDKHPFSALMIALVWDLTCLAVLVLAVAFIVKAVL